MEQAPSSPSRHRNRSFTGSVRDACWAKADVVPGRHPERWRKDVAGNVVCRKFSGGCHGCLCYEYDHITPFSKGGETDVANCQILQTRVNRGKSNLDLSAEEIRQFSCDIKFTDKELDVIEMAVYGDVVRPGMECRCKSVSEAMGTSLKGFKYQQQMACTLPYSGRENQEKSGSQ